MYAYTTMSSPLGEITLVADQKNLLALYVNDTHMPLKDKASKEAKHPVLHRTVTQLKEYFKGERRDFDLPLSPEGTEFQTKAWEALCKIPFGKVWSYGKQAQYLKNPNAQRAVGGANGKNPIPIIIPCHRVVGSTGKLTGFSGGIDMKVYLLKHEGHAVDAHALKLL